MRDRLRLRRFWLTSAGLCGLAAPVSSDEIRYVVEDRALHRVDPKLFGHFLERPSWGETGVEGALVPGTSQLQPGVLDRLRQMRIPILRFPGGTDVDYIDWTDMIDNAPGRAKPERPVTRGHRGDAVTNRFGYDEFLRLCRDLGAEPLLVVNLGDALLRRKPLEAAARHAAGLLAYCNLAAGAPRPEGMPDWAAVRARNGAAAPWGVRHVQLGNETWFFLDRIRELGIADPEAHFVSCLAAYVTALRAVDPSIRILVDAISGRAADRIHAELGDRVNFLVQHEYMPWQIPEVRSGGKRVRADGLTEEEIWKAWVAIPNSTNEQGESVLEGTALERGRALGYRAAVTEWNWNGGWSDGNDRPAFNSSFARGVGAAGYLHAFLRAGDVVEIACQSMTVGHRWTIAGIHADSASEEESYFQPTGQVTMLYASHHGDRLLALRADDIPSYAQPYEMGGIRPKERVAWVDAVVTADDRAIYLHAINRRFREPQPIALDLSAFGGLPGKAVHHWLAGRLYDGPRVGDPREIGRITDEPVAFDGKVLKAVLPERSVSVLEIPRR